MKFLLSSCVFILFGLQAMAQQKPFVLEGKIKGLSDGYIFMSYFDDLLEKRITDSSLVHNGNFTINGKLSGPTEAYIMTDRKVQRIENVLSVYIVPAKMTIDLDHDNLRESAVLKGSYVQDQADLLKKRKVGVNARLEPFSKAFDKANMEYIEARRAGRDSLTLEKLLNTAEEARNAMDPFREELSKIDLEFMNEFPGSYITASLMRYKIGSMQLAEAEERYSKLDGEIKTSSLGKEIKKELDGLRMGSPGARAYVFSSSELRGEPLNLSDYKGRYVLLDFWASWCVPCRKGNPHLLTLYKKYKDKGFEIIGISDDDSNLEAWRKAVEKDEIGVWKHVLRGLKYDGKNFDRTNDISDRYGIHTLPTKILINPDGMIIGRYGGGGESDEAMDKKLEEVFGE